MFLTYHTLRLEFIFLLLKINTAGLFGSPNWVEISYLIHFKAWGYKWKSTVLANVVSFAIPIGPTTRAVFDSVVCVDCGLRVVGNGELNAQVLWPLQWVSRTAASCLHLLPIEQKRNIPFCNWYVALLWKKKHFK